MGEERPHRNDLGIATTGREITTISIRGAISPCTEKIIKVEGDRQVASLTTIDVLNFSQRDHIGFAAGAPEVPLDLRVGALFLLLTHLMHFVVDDLKTTGKHHCAG